MAVAGHPTAGQERYHVRTPVWRISDPPAVGTNCRSLLRVRISLPKGAITSKIKHAIKLKISPARLSQLLQPSLAFCFSLSRAGRYAVIGCKLKQNANEGCNSCATVVQVLQDLFYVLLHVLFYLWLLLKWYFTLNLRSKALTLSSNLSPFCVVFAVMWFSSMVIYKFSAEKKSK